MTPNTPTRELLAMISTCRVDSSKAERRFIAKWIRPLGVESDLAGNLIKRIGESPILWSCHTDTVHRLPGIQSVTLTKGKIALAAKSKSNCLGADCTTGIWIMREMILAKVPGLYIFHRGEEIGGIGSRHISEETPELLDGIRFAIALDRRGKHDVVTHQGSRCCSESFALSLASELNKGGLAYAPDSSGVFTDTANYTSQIPECTNLSVGYEHAHTANETQSLPHAQALLTALMRLDQSKLVEARKTTDDDFADDKWSYKKSPYYTTAKSEDRLANLIANEPDLAAEIFDDYGISYGDFIEYVYDRTGIYRGESN